MFLELELLRIDFVELLLVFVEIFAVFASYLCSICGLMLIKFQVVFVVDIICWTPWVLLLISWILCRIRGGNKTYDTYLTNRKTKTPLSRIIRFKHKDESLNLVVVENSH